MESYLSKIYYFQPLTESKNIKLRDKKLVLPKGTDSIGYTYFNNKMHVFPRGGTQGFGCFEVKKATPDSLEETIRQHFEIKKIEKL